MRRAILRSSFARASARQAASHTRKGCRAEAAQTRRRTRSPFSHSKVCVTRQNLALKRLLSNSALEFPTIRRFAFGLMRAFLSAMDGIEKRFVYIVRSDSDPSCHYIGITSDIAEPLEWRNHGPSGYTADHRP